MLGRSSLILKGRSPKFFGFVDTAVALRYNFADNLGRLGKLRPRALLPVRSDVDLFAARGLALDQLYTTLTHSHGLGWHSAISAGYLEEMYAGIGGEVLYRPFNTRFALGAEAWQVFKRNPFATLNMGFNGDHVLSAHVNAWYNLPSWDLTLKGRFGRYLAEDIGGTVALQKTFANGARIEAFTTLTDQRDIDIFGESSHAYHGLKMVLPLGGLKYVPDLTQMTVNATPLGRDTGQSLHKPLDLYEATHPFSFHHLSQHWSDITLPEER